jgi:hypothetical protein
MRLLEVIVRLGVAGTRLLKNCEVGNSRNEAVGGHWKVGSSRDEAACEVGSSRDEAAEVHSEVGRSRDEAAGRSL